MNTNLGLALLGIAGIALAALSVRLGVIGVRGGSVHRAESPVLFWFAIVGGCVVSGAAVIFAIVK